MLVSSHVPEKDVVDDHDGDIDDDKWWCWWLRWNLVRMNNDQRNVRDRLRNATNVVQLVGPEDSD